MNMTGKPDVCIGWMHLVNSSSATCGVGLNAVRSLERFAMVGCCLGLKSLGSSPEARVNTNGVYIKPGSCSAYMCMHHGQMQRAHW